MTIVDTVTEASADMKSYTGEMVETANLTSSLAQEALSSTNTAEENVTEVAHVSEQLSGTIQEITSRVSQAAEVVLRAMEQTEEGNKRVQDLNEAGKKIGGVVKLIQRIAEQTNLLALNATIEAVRAGEAGKGFEVVANEVKSLATQTSEATEQITSHILGMQNATDLAVEAIHHIREIVDEINEMPRLISEAVETQSMATSQISTNLADASQATNEVTSNINSFHEAASQSGKTARELLTHSEVMSNQAQALSTAVHKYMEDLKSI